MFNSKSWRLFPFVIISMMCPQVCLPQSIDYNTIKDVRQRSTVELYRSHFEPGSILRNGSRYYKYYYHNTLGNQFLDPEIDHEGSIIFKGIVFKNTAIRYDIYNDLVVVSGSDDGLSDFFMPDIRNISEFMVHSRKFINYNDTTNGILNDGIYEVGFEGEKTTLLVKRKKNFIKSQSQRQGEKNSFTIDDQYYLITTNGAYRLRNGKDIVKSMESNPDIVTYIREQKLKFKPGKRSWEEALRKVLSYYERLE